MWLDDHVTDVTGIARLAAKQTAVEHDPAPDARGHDHCEVVSTAFGRADPTFTQGECLGVVVDSKAYATGGVMSLELSEQARTQGELSPRTDVERRHCLATGAHGASTACAAGHDDTSRPRGARCDLDEVRHHAKQRFRVRRCRSACPVLPDDDASRVHEPYGELRAADVEGETQLAVADLISQDGAQS